MRAVIQRVAKARVSVAEEIVGQIGPGLCILLGVARTDTASDTERLADKICQLRIFEDDQGKMNRSTIEIGAELLVISQFTLYGDCRKGNRPSFSDAAPPAQAEQLYKQFVDRLRQSGLRLATGVFQARMRVSLVNDGPVTLVLES
ncbi:MAG TPA: D-aminoacyl-tRNA deacylase [Verrucomicrobiae bacterium]|nr:D-aminoacyl-tRNA deacylase [Verrucomicrobiae bacterium]